MCAQRGICDQVQFPEARADRRDLTGGTLGTPDREELELDLKNLYSTNHFTHNEQRKTLAGLICLSAPFMNDSPTSVL